MIEIKINNEEHILELLNNLSAQIENKSSLMRTIAGTMRSAVGQNFREGGRPAWQGLKYRKGTPLIKSGVLKNSIKDHYDNNTAIVGTNLKYAGIHQFGGITKPHKIRPRYKKALAFNGNIMQSVNHPGSKIPARPFLKLTEQDEMDVMEDIQDYFRNILK